MPMVICGLYEQSKSGESLVQHAAGTWPPFPVGNARPLLFCRFLTASGGSVTLG
jgi:hypothetical protein